MVEVMKLWGGEEREVVATVVDYGLGQEYYEIHFKVFQVWTE